MLGEAPRHGYELKTEFESRTGGIWPLNVGQVYSTLDRLDRDGLVKPIAAGAREGGAGRAQRAFAITPAGRRELDGWLRSGALPETPRDELLVKVLVVAARGSPEDALDVISAQRTALYDRLQAHRRAAPKDDLAVELVHDALAVRTEADLLWLDRCEERLRLEHPRRRGQRAAGGRR